MSKWENEFDCYDRMKRLEKEAELQRRKFAEHVEGLSRGCRKTEGIILQDIQKRRSNNYLFHFTDEYMAEYDFIQ